MLGLDIPCMLMVPLLVVKCVQLAKFSFCYNVLITINKIYFSKICLTEDVHLTISIQSHVFQHREDHWNLQMSFSLDIFSGLNLKARMEVDNPRSNRATHLLTAYI